MSMVEIGISGWTYKGWRGTFYPPELPIKNELSYASRELPSIEINGTFYCLQSPDSYRDWYDSTPENFIFSVKGSKFITHMKKLNDVEVPLANFMASGLLILKEKRGPFLWQFPPNMSFNPEKIETFLKLLPRDFKQAARLGKKNTLVNQPPYLKVDYNFPMKHAFEIRHDSFHNPWFIELLRTYNVALVFADTAGKWPYMEDITSDFIYVRLHGDRKIYVSGYDEAALDFWSRRIETWKSGGEAADRLTLTEELAPMRARDVYVYFDNDAKVRAPVDAKFLICLLKQRRHL
ncbi:MAG TPA: DUF72 domain-containing protein [Bacteriovoracaceae bacterium]|nr:DUF72 domain-containing protein [Bacteriovoracaceae bacterium]